MPRDTAFEPTDPANETELSSGFIAIFPSDDPAARRAVADIMRRLGEPRTESGRKVRAIEEARGLEIAAAATPAERRAVMVAHADADDALLTSVLGSNFVGFLNSRYAGRRAR